MEWAINSRVVARCVDYLQLHAATMIRRGRAFVFTGRTGAGKSTLAAGLLSRGWDYFSDEFAFVSPASLHVHPFPKAVCVKQGSFDIVRRLGLPIGRTWYGTQAGKGPIRFIRPPPTRPSDSLPRPVRFIVFPRYAEAATPRLRRMSRAEAAFELGRCVFNRHIFGTRTTSLLAETVRGADCYELVSGRIEATCELLETLRPDGR